MRGLIIGCCVMCAGGGLYVGVGNRGIDYDGSLAEVRAELVSMPLPDELQESIEEGRGSVETDTSDSDKVSWRFYVEDHELGRVTAKLSPVDSDTTNVQVEWDPGAALPKGSNSRAVAMQPLVEQVAETFVAEQIDASLEDRPFNKRVVALQLAAYVGSHPKEMRQYMARVQALAEEAETGSGELGGEMAGEGGTDHVQFRPGKPMVSAKPTTDLSKYQ